MTRVFTHSNAFHPDELLAIALLQDSVLRDQRVDIVRTRDPAVLAKAQQDPSAFVIDVGFVYDPAQLNFDHHQGAMTRSWPDGTPYSSCGLIWSWLRERGALIGWGGDDVLDRFEEQVILPADKHDNGIGAPWPEGMFLCGYNRSDKDAKTARDAFDRALEVAADLIANVRLDVQKDMEAKHRMEQALAEPIHAEHVVVIEDMRAHRFAYWAAKLSQGDVKLVITRRKGPGPQWNLTSTPRDLDDMFSIHCPAPEAWRGQPPHAVMTPEGEATVVFCHKTGFLTVVEGSVTQAIAIAQQIVAIDHEAQTP